MDKEYIRKRISTLRDAKGISASKLSRDIGQNKDYIGHIEKGKALPSLENFLEICQCLDISCGDFFDDKTEYPIQYKELFNLLNKLDSIDLATIIEFIKFVVIKKK